ncbi:DUF6879 family protein [Kitasatospora sp. NPDC090308]|uniref:DUF6879 family protein n=1 Tax=Kitasatospora sp. NPDC090308 TaxID=3364082 RepID=UPI003803A16C
MQSNAPDFRTLLRETEKSAVHLEMRDQYSIADEVEQFAAWKAGHRYAMENRSEWWHPFHDFVVETIARGVTIRRARIVSEPVTEYIRYEHSHTFTNIAAGEQIRWLPRIRALDLALPGADFWLFDSRIVRFNLFTGDGAWAHPRHVMTEEPATVGLCAKAFEAVWERAVPHADFEV